jgi:hypothetical protein
MEIKYTEQELNSIDKTLLIKMFLNLQNQMETLTVEMDAKKALIRAEDMKKRRFFYCRTAAERRTTQRQHSSQREGEYTAYHFGSFLIYQPMLPFFVP